MELAIPSRYGAVKVHEVFSEGASLVEASELYHPSSDNFILSDAKDRFLL